MGLCASLGSRFCNVGNEPIPTKHKSRLLICPKADLSLRDWVDASAQGTNLWFL